MRNAGEDVDIAHLHPGCAGGRIGEKLGAFGHPRHAQARFGQLQIPWPIIILEDSPRLGMDDHRHAESRRNRIDGDVVVGRADPAGREQIVVSGTEQVDRLADPLLVVGDDPHLGQPDALLVQPGRDLRDILVLGPAGQDLIADHHQSGGPLLGLILHPPSGSLRRAERLSRDYDSIYHRCR